MTLKSGKYQVYGDPKPDGTYQLQKTLWDGTNIQVSQRVGDEERMWVRDKLTRLHVAGFLTAAEYHARDSAAEKAVTRPDLNRLIADLPKEEDDWRKERKVPMDKALLQEAIEATTPRRRGPVPIVTLLMTIVSLIVGATGVSLHPATPAVLWPAVTLMVAAIFTFWAGYSIP